MKAKNLISNISNKYLLKGIISYFPYKCKNTLFNILRYDKKCQKKF